MAGVLMASRLAATSLGQPADTGQLDEGLRARSDSHHAVVGDHACECSRDSRALGDIQIRAKPGGPEMSATLPAWRATTGSRECLTPFS
jgi:hypothetical protein